MSTVTAQLESAERVAELLLEQLTGPVRFTQAVGGLVQDGVDTFVEIGPGQVLAGLVRRCDRSLRTFSVGDPASLEKLEEIALRSLMADFAHSKARSRSSPGRHVGSGRRSAASSARAGARVAVNYRASADAAEEIAGEIGGIAVAGDVADPEQAAALVEQVEAELGDLDCLVNNAGVTRDGADRADERRRLGRGPRHEPPRDVQHLPCRLAQDAPPPLRLDRQPDERGRDPRQPGPGELRGVEGRDHRADEVARAGSSELVACV